MGTDDKGIAVILLVAGIGVFPFGIVIIKQQWEEYKKKEGRERRIVLFFEMIDLWSTWVLFLSLLLILGGAALLWR
ncbi:hypothetical protein NSQ51_13285 [Geobacillus sp. FSL K6-0789]|uniref:Uncharacterized protein n=2 Tax=Geobacillus stearothermophilus TaxID=1422 RepID=A0A3L7DE37_GEOSE|nr:MULTISPECIES: hypothetical protein [Geobacillus]ASS86924.1 hypothetical protein GLN3_07180 [Geobacillus lituanicus]MED0654441.1 hypothetical protein [Anoxybacillus geothermalis]KAF6510602.1 hypothetical protein GS8_2759 [Geobacillus stearothermophilus]KMY57253.1 hypothetical protein AA904_14475 [Geobacillus stearothermophilus]KMY58067.1 hypothetical protein AA905_13850 [Geobacillus stearothermophilus]